MTMIWMKRSFLAVLPAAFLGACVSQSSYDALEAQNRQLQAQNQANQQQISELNTQVNRLQHAIRYTVNSDLLFASGSWQLSKDGEDIMQKVASQLAPFQTRRIVINGYTDNAPIGAALKKQGVSTNEMLSEKRAESVMQFLAGHGVNQNMMSAKGWGDAQPIAPNNTTAGRSENRRVEITFADSAGS